MPEAGLPARHLLDSVVVSPRTLGAAEVAVTSTHTLDLARFQALPNAGDDLFRGLARLPGLAAPFGDGVSLLRVAVVVVVRGSRT